jgi:hypothetical protein
MRGFLYAIMQLAFTDEQVYTGNYTTVAINRKNNQPPLRALI